MYLATTQRLLFLVTHLISLSAAAEDKLTCPSEWEEGEKYTLTCTVLISEFNNEKCPHLSFGIVDFKFTLEGSDPSSQCIVQNVTTSCGGSLNSAGCRCRETTSEAYVLEYKVQANKSQHEGGTWRCVPNCLVGDNLDNKYNNSTLANFKQLQCGPVSVSSASSAVSEHGLCGMRMCLLLLLISLSEALIGSWGMGILKAIGHFCNDKKNTTWKFT